MRLLGAVRAGVEVSIPGERGRGGKEWGEDGRGEFLRE